MTLDEGFDVIGDVHGEAEKLCGLLTAMGYREDNGHWRHRRRRAVLVGDLSDRGPHPRATVSIARSMVEHGAAFSAAGNHEFNAIGYATLRNDNSGEYVRARTGPEAKKHFAQHSAYLNDVGLDSTLHREHVEWFTKLPLWLELDGLRIVHACWDPPSMKVVEELTDGPAVTLGLVQAAAEKGSPAHKAIEHLIKGPQVPSRESRPDPDGTMRTEMRVSWWNLDKNTADNQNPSGRVGNTLKRNVTNRGFHDGKRTP